MKDFIEIDARSPDAPEARRPLLEARSAWKPSVPALLSGLCALVLSVFLSPLAVVRVLMGLVSLVGIQASALAQPKQRLRVFHDRLEIDRLFFHIVLRRKIVSRKHITRVSFGLWGERAHLRIFHPGGGSFTKASSVYYLPGREARNARRIFLSWSLSAPMTRLGYDHFSITDWLAS